jgi:hypothetical protein
LLNFTIVDLREISVKLPYGTKVFRSLQRDDIVAPAANFFEPFAGSHWHGHNDLEWILTFQ